MWTLGVGDVDVDVGTQGVGDVDVGTQGVEGVYVGNLGSYAEQGRAGIPTVKMCLAALVCTCN